MSRFERQDELNNPRHQVPEFTRLVEKGLSRRRFLGGAAALGAAAFFTVSPLSRAVAAATKAGPLLGFTPVPASTRDTFTVPAGYKAERLVSWGDPLFGTVPEFSETGNSAAAQAGQFGDNNDGMSFFAIDDRTAILAINNEYCNYEHMFPHQGKHMSAENVKCAQAAHGVSILTLEKQNGRWQLVKDGQYNRRIHASTPMAISGPAKGHDLLKTAADPKGERVLGTFNNCANGMTPWGTYPTSPARKTSTAISAAGITPTLPRPRPVMALAGKTRAGSGINTTHVLIWPKIPTSPTALAGWWKSIPKIRTQSR